MSAAQIALTKEQVYDAEIFPLMKQIIDSCNRAKIAMVADFLLDGDLHCTTGIVDDSHEPDAQIRQAFELCRPAASRSPLMITVRDGDGKVIRMEAVL